MSKKSKQKKQKQRKTKAARPTGMSLSFWQQKEQLYPILGILVVTFLAFVPALSAGFVNWDDPPNLLENPNLEVFNWQSIVNIFNPETGLVIGNYNPLPIFTFAIEKAIFGLEPKVFHFNNLLLHLGCTFLVYRIMLKLKLSVWAAAIAALMFGIHPMRVESVAWVTERKDVLFGVFYLGAIFTYIRHLESKNKKQFYYIATLVLFVISLFAKIQAVALPLSLLAIDYWFKRPIAINRITEKIPFFGLSLLFGLAGIVFLGQEGSLNSSEYFTPFDRVFIGMFSYCAYLYKLIVPYPLSPLYPYPSELDWYFYASPLPVLAILGALWVAFKRDYRAIVFAFAFFTFNVMFLLQVLGAGQGFLADRFTYIPYIGFFFLAGYAYDYFTKEKPTIQSYLQMGLAAYFVLSAMSTFMQCKIWKNSKTLWTKVIEHHPNAYTAWANIGHFHRDNNNFNEAIENYNQAISIRPEKATTYNSRGKLYFENGQSQKGIDDYNRAIERDSSIAEIFVNRGAAYGATGKMDLALRDLNKAVELDPTFKNAYFNRSIAYMNRGQYDLAIQDYTEYLKLDPYNADIWYERGAAKAQLQQYNEAIQDYNMAINLSPNKGLFYLLRSQAYKALGNKSQALLDAQMAQRKGENVSQDYMRSVQ